MKYVDNRIENAKEVRFGDLFLLDGFDHVGVEYIKTSEDGAVGLRVEEIEDFFGDTWVSPFELELHRVS